MSCVNKTKSQAVAASGFYAMLEPLKKTCRLRFTDAELYALVEEVEKMAPVVLAKHDYKISVTDFQKQAACLCDRDSVNAVSCVPRTVHDREKFKDIRTHLKTKAVAVPLHGRHRLLKYSWLIFLNLYELVAAS